MANFTEIDEEFVCENCGKNVEKLNLFYEGINIYAKQNHIYPTPCNFGNFYRVNLNDFGFGQKTNQD